MGNHAFSLSPQTEIKRSIIKRDSTHKTSLYADYLVPFFLDHMLPADTFNGRTSLFGRLATPKLPIMDDLYMDTFYFFVPYRLLWDNWRKLMGEQDNPGDSTSYLVPDIKVLAGDNDPHTLMDYFGLPLGKGFGDTGQEKISALPFIAYNLIWNEFFRDQNLQTRALVDKTDVQKEFQTSGHAYNYVLRKRGKRHDYFTSCTPWPQKGTAVKIPLGSTAPVIGDGKTLGLQNNHQLFGLNYYDGVQNKAYPRVALYGTNVGTSAYGTVPELNYPANSWGVSLDPTKSGLIADLSSATASTVNALRQAFQLQRLLERDARSGTRYVETIKSHFLTVCPDFRLQRPEYIGGSTCRININPVQQTSSTDEESPQGHLSAYGTVHDNNGTFNYSATEHGLVMGLVSVRANLTYQQGINRHFTKRSRYDFYWPVLANLGEQAVLNKEIYYDPAGGHDDEVFGYQEAWAEYRYKPNQISGVMRSTAPTPLDAWHLAEKFESLPVLGNTFIQSTTPLERCVAVTDEPHILLDTYTSLRCVRPMPLYSVPGMIDHF